VTTAHTDKPLEETLRFSLDDPVAIDIAYCDLVHARDPNPNGPYDLRIRGTRQPDAVAVRGFLPLLQVEGALLSSGALLQPIDVAQLPAGERSHYAVPLVKWALTITKRRRGNGEWTYDVAVRRGGDPEVDLRHYLRCLHDAADRALPVLAAHGFAVGAAEVISIAGTLFGARVYHAAHPASRQATDLTMDHSRTDGRGR
jgi:hypothetical protein